MLPLRCDGLTGHCKNHWVTSSLNEIVLDAAEPAALAEFWCAVLGWQVVDSGDDFYELRPGPVLEDQLLAALRGGTALPSLLISPTRDVKAGKNRVHLDVSPIDCSHDEEVERLLALGATRVDIGQDPADSWTVLADPAGNEFCVLRSLAEGHFNP